MENTILLEKRNLINLLIGLVLGMFLLFSHSPISMYGSLLTLFVFMIHLLMNYTSIYLKYLYFIFGVATATLGCFSIETGRFYLYEIGSPTGFEGALPLMTFFYWVLMTTIAVNDDRIVKRNEHKGTSFRLCTQLKNNSANNVAWLMTAVATVLVLYLFLTVLPNPSFALGMDRFQYSAAFNYGRLYSLSIKLINYLIVPCIVVAVLNKSKLGWAALLTYCLYAFWVGNKFGIYFVLLCYFTMIYNQTIMAEINKARRVVIGTGIGILVLVIVAVFAMSFTSSKGSMEYIQARLAQQGQLWWKTYSMSTEAHWTQFGQEINGLLYGSPRTEDNVGANYGIYNIMYLTSPATTIDAKLAAGSIYTEAGFAAAYYYFGMIGCIVFAIAGGLLASEIINAFIYYIGCAQFVRVFICIHMYMALKSALSSFVFFRFFNTVALIGYIILIVLKDKVFVIGKQGS